MPTDDSYDRIRRDFEELEVEEQAQFLIQASATTLATGIERIGAVLADGLEDVVGHDRRRSSKTGKTGTSGPGPAEPETAERQAPPEESESEE